MRSLTLRSLLFLSLAATSLLRARPVDLSIPSGGHGPIDSRGFAQHWVELTEVDFGQGLSLPLRLNLLSARVGNHGFGAGLWQSPLLSAGILTRSEKQLSVLLPCGRVLIMDAAQPGRFTTPDGEWVGVVKGPRTLISREDGWEMEFNQKGHLIRLRTDAGRTVLWNRMADGSLRTLTEVAQNRPAATGLTVNKDAATGQVTSLEARTAAGVKTWKLGYVDAGKRLTEITFPDRSVERLRYTFDAAGNPGLTIQSRSLTETTLVWRKGVHTLMSDGLWSYAFKREKGDLYPLTTRTGPGGVKEVFHDDFENSRTLFTSADGTQTIRQNVIATGPAKGKLQSITRILGENQAPGVQNKEPGTKNKEQLLYQASYDPQTGMLTEEVDALGHKTLHQHELHGSTPHSGVKRHVATDPLGHKTITEFDLHGNLLATTNALGHTTRHEYDAQNRRVKTTGPDGIVVETLTYNAQGKIETHTDALGAVTKYGYDAQGNQTSITDALGNITRHVYDSRGNRTATIDALGHTTHFEYDAGGRLIATILPEVAQGAGFSNSPLTPSGAAASSTTPSPSPSALSSRTVYSYDAKGRRIRTTAPDGTVTSSSTYDAFGRITSETNALGHVTKFEYDLKKGAIGCKSCSSSAQPTRIISPSARITERTYDVDHRLLTETIAAGTPEAATTRNTYDLAGHLLSTTDPLGRTTTFEYDATGNRTAVLFADKTKRSNAYNALGQLTAETNELGHTTKRTYDAHGNLIAITDPEGHTTRTLFGSGDDSSPKTTKADESSALQKLRAIAHAALHRPTMTISAAGIRTQIDYDALGRRIAITKAPGTPEASTTRHEYDAVGNETATITNIGAAANPQPGTNNQEQRTEHSYDPRRRRLTTTDALNRTTTFLYLDDASEAAACCGGSPASSRATAILHPDGTREEQIHNALGQLIETRDANVTTANDKLRTENRELRTGIRYAYDEDGRLTTLTDARGSVTKWRYDARGKLQSKTYPDGTTEIYEHNAAGQLISRLRPNGVSATYTYSPRGQLLTIRWSDGKTEPSTFAYDAAGRMTLAENLSAKITRTHTATGRLQKETQQINYATVLPPGSTPQAPSPFTAEIGYAYTPDGQIAELTYPDQSTVSYHYNERGELAEVQDSETTQNSKLITHNYVYARRPDGRITALTLPNGTTTHKTYDEVGRLSEIKHLTPENTVLFSEASHYDQRDRRTARQHADGSADLFAYDPVGQVIAAAYGEAADKVASALAEPSKPSSAANSTPSTTPQATSFKPSQTFEYDSAGNRLQFTDNGTTTRYITNPANQHTQIATGAAVLEPQFDPLGNLLRDDHNTYTWDSDIHLLSVETKIPNQNSEISNFKYDALHRRVARYESDTGTTTLFIMDGWNVISESSLSPSLKIAQSLRLVWGEDLSRSLQGAGGIGGLLSTNHQQESITNWFHFDSNGNVAALSGTNGQKSALYCYDAFGKTILAQGSAANLNRYQFSTKPIERGSGLAFYGFRYYAPTLGRWPSKDPRREQGGINLYSLIRNGMVNRLDFLGLEEVDDVLQMTGDPSVSLDVNLDVDVTIDWDAKTVTVRNAVPTGDVGKSWNVILALGTVTVTTNAGANAQAWVSVTPKFSTKYVGSELRDVVEYELAGSMQLTVTVSTQVEVEFEVPILGVAFSVGGGLSDTNAVKPDNNGQKFSHSRPANQTCPSP